MDTMKILVKLMKTLHCAAPCSDKMKHKLFNVKAKERDWFQAIRSYNDCKYWWYVHNMLHQLVAQWLPSVVSDIPDIKSIGAQLHFLMQAYYELDHLVHRKKDPTKTGISFVKKQLSSFPTYWRVQGHTLDNFFFDSPIWIKVAR